MLSASSIIHQLLRNAVCVHDTPMDRARKKVFLQWVVSLTLVTTVVLITLCFFRTADTVILYIIAMTTLLAASVISIADLIYTKALQTRVPLTAAAGMTAATLVMDFALSPEASDRVWPLLVVPLLLMQQMHLPRRVVRSFAMGCFLWLLFIRIDRTFDVGIRLFPWITSQATRLKHLCGCESQPCTGYLVRNTWLLVSEAVALIAAYVASTALASDVQRDRIRLQRALEVTSKMMGYIAGLELTEAESLLFRRQGDLDPQLADSFSSVLANLLVYRPYLPDGLLDNVSTAMPGSPGGGLLEMPNSGVLSVVFTDICSSTAIWEQTPEPMKVALRIHNTIVRTCIRDFHGYEVKTIGDAFMIAFTESADAVNFSLEVQNELAATAWPDGLLCPLQELHPHLEGLAVRIGVNSGPVTVEVNEVTGRSDLHGHTVNKASRFEARCRPGFVAVAQSQYTSLHEERHLNAHICAHVETAVLAGVSERATLCHLVPASLAQRAEAVVQPLAPSAAQAALGMAFRSTMPSPSGEKGGRRLSESILPCAGLERVASATVGSVNIVVPEDVAGAAELAEAGMKLNAAVRGIVTCLERTGGQPVTLVGCMYVVGWNVMRGCPSHVENALRFVSFFNGTLRNNKEGLFPSTVGLVRGSGMRGHVGTSSLRYLTVCGACVRLGASLSAWAVQLETFGLFASLVGSGNSGGAHSPIRPVAYCRTPTATLPVYEVEPEPPNTRKRRAGDSLTRVERIDRWGWSPAYWTAFEKEKFWEIHAHAEQVGDAMLLRVAQQMRDGFFAPHPIAL